MMNYVGSISILDRGDAPAMEVIDRNTRSLAQRVSNETKEELNKVMTRVGNIYNAYDMSVQSQFDMTHSPNVEYIGDIKELESILTDTVKKKKYQQQVTVFIVGFQNVSSQKMHLLQQVNQVSSCILLSWGKKRLEKSLQQAKDDITSLSEKLLAMQTETDAKDEKLQQLYKQIDLKTSDVTRYKTAAEAAKKAAQDSNEQIHFRDEKINELQQKLNTLEAELSRLNLEKEQNQKKMEESDASSMLKVDIVLKELDDKKPSVDDTSQSLESQFHEQISEIEKQHREETEELTKVHEQELIQKTVGSVFSKYFYCSILSCGFLQGK
ncbi:hypothetical protein ACJMK2_025025 [Sinanodonta woodiana]|uniref:Uncharacterized protein n=1 Tax=Sinanodonta woodiana TaxID=1069815 RepID=A0ABD3XH43_SINWO